MNKLLIIVFVAVTVNGLDEILEPRETLSLLKERVEKAVNNLADFRKNFSSPPNRVLEEFEAAPLQAITLIAARFINETQNMVEIAKSEGKDADHCPEEIRNELKNAIEGTISAFDRCINNEQLSINVVTRDIDLKISEGDNLFSELTRTGDICQYQVLPQVCLSRRLPPVQLTVYIFESTAQRLRTKAEKLNSAESVQHCFQQPKFTFNIAVANVRESLRHCINNSKSQVV